MAPRRKLPTKRKAKARKPAAATSWRTTASTVVSALTGAALIALKSKLGLNTESKYSTLATTTFTPTTTLVKSFDVLTSTPIPQDNTAQGRSGLTVRMTKWKIHGTIDNTLANLLTTRFRIIICKNKGIALGASAIVVADVLERTTDINSPHLIDKTADISYLYDKTFNIDPVAAGGKQQFNFSFIYSPKNHHLTWTVADTTGTSADLLGGLISVFIMADGFTAANAPTLNVARELYWVDN